jgi:hypothetical protein
MEAAPLLDRADTAALQAADGRHHVGTFENFDQPVENALVVLRPGLQIFFQYELGLANRLNCQLLIIHACHPEIAPA